MERLEKERDNAVARYAAGVAERAELLERNNAQAKIINEYRNDDVYFQIAELKAQVATGRRGVIEDAAKVAESLPGQRGNSPEHLVGMRIAAAIRALKEDDQ